MHDRWGVRLSLGRRLTVVLVLFAGVVALAVWAVVGFLLPTTPTVDFSTGHTPGTPVDLTVQTVGTSGFGPHPTWVSYLVRNQNGQWVHSTLWSLPAHTRINLTIDQYDSGSPLRNQEWGLVTGTAGDVEILNGKPTPVYDSNSGNGVGHTFSIPTLGVNVPLVGISSDAKNPCSGAPCTTNFAHNVIKASFVTPSAGEYPWQCFVPCGLGFLYGNGGPMSTIGYMGGFLDVVA